MQSKFAIAGHPLHPVMVAVPVGLFIWALIADIVFGIRDEQGWYDIAFWSGIAAWVSGLAAAFPGFGDYLTMARHTEARDMAAIHMVLNVTTVGCYIAAMILMLDNGAIELNGKYQAVLGLHAFGTLLLAVSGWLGGEMVYRHHLGMIPGHAEEPVSMRRAA